MNRLLLRWGKDVATAVCSSILGLATRCFTATTDIHQCALHILVNDVGNQRLGRNAFRQSLSLQFGEIFAGDTEIDAVVTAAGCFDHIRA